MKHPYIPIGCDQQGRVSEPWPYTRPPQPADAATEVGCDDGDDEGFALFFVALAAAIIGCLILILTTMALYG